MKQVYILCGPSGCGKSTYADKMLKAKHVDNMVVLSTDDYHYNASGEYVFQPDQLGKFHAQNLAHFIVCLSGRFHIKLCPVFFQIHSGASCSSSVQVSGR